MAWKPKEKTISVEEAIQIAKKELAPYWFGISPQFAGVQNNNEYSVLPISSDFSKKNWLLIFIDLTHFTGELAVLYAREWHKRYGSHNLSTLLVLIPSYSFLEVPETLRQFLEDENLKFPLVVDFDQTISAAFDLDSTPKIVLVDHGKRFFEYSGYSGIMATELEIQNFLRTSDPGLPLPQVFRTTQVVFHDVNEMEFGFEPKPRKTKALTLSGFVESAGGYRTGNFHEVRPVRLSDLGHFISGSWIQDRERIATSDPHASIAVSTSLSAFSIVAQSLSKTIEVPKISVEIDGLPAYDAIAGDDLIMDDQGQSILKLNKPRLYHLFVNLPKKQHEITLRFLNADLAPSSLYGFRFGDK